MNILSINALAMLFTLIVRFFSDTRPVDDIMVFLLTALVLALIKPDKTYPRADYRTDEVRPLRESTMKTGGVKDVPKTARPEHPHNMVVKPSFTTRPPSKENEFPKSKKPERPSDIVVMDGKVVSGMNKTEGPE